MGSTPSIGTIIHGGSRFHSDLAVHRHQRKETERFTCFACEDRLKRDKVNRDIIWLKDEALEKSANFPALEVIAADIAVDLATFEQFSTIADGLTR